MEFIRNDHSIFRIKLRNAEVEHGMVSWANHEHVVVFVQTLMLSTERMDVMHLRVKGTRAQLDPFATDLTVILIQLLETPCFGRVADDAYRGASHPGRGILDTLADLRWWRLPGDLGESR